MKTESAEDVARRFDTEPDYVGVKSADFSMVALLKRYPKGVPPHIRARAMGLLDEDGKPDMAAEQREYRGVVLKLRAAMGLTADDLVGDDEEEED